MRIFILENQKDISYFTRQPESFPGGHLFSGEIETDEPHTVIRGSFAVFNSELIVQYSEVTDSHPIDGLDVSAINPNFESYDTLLNNNPPKPAKLLNAQPGIQSYNHSTLIKSVTADGRTPFYRTTAYLQDKRIDLQTMSMLSGTYMSTADDILDARTGLASVGRYALPNPFPPLYRFLVFPDSGIQLDYGTVRPGFGQSGGGVEVVNTQVPTGNGTVFKHYFDIPWS